MMGKMTWLSPRTLSVAFMAFHLLVFLQRGSIDPVFFVLSATLSGFVIGIPAGDRAYSESGDGYEIMQLVLPVVYGCAGCVLSGVTFALLVSAGLIAWN